METQVQYPEWQKAIREAQVQYQAHVTEQNAKWAEEQRERKLRDIEQMRQMVINAGLELPASETGIWEFDGYIFEVWEGSSYERYVRELRVKKIVPQSSNEQSEDVWEYGYRHIVSVSVELRQCDGSYIAAALDDVDVLAEEQIAVNERALQKAQTHANTPAVKAEPPSLAEQLAELIREIVREEMGVVRDSQFESYL